MSNLGISESLDGKPNVSQTVIKPIKKIEETLNSPEQFSKIKKRRSHYQRLNLKTLDLEQKEYRILKSSHKVKHTKHIHLIYDRPVSQNQGKLLENHLQGIKRLSLSSNELNLEKTGFKKLLSNKITSFSLLNILEGNNPIKSLGFMQLRTLKVQNFKPQELLERNVLQLQNLEKFSYKQQDEGDFDEDFLGFCSLLTKLKNLQSLDLDYSDRKRSDQRSHMRLVHLLDEVKCLKKLKSLSMQLSASDSENGLIIDYVIRKVCKKLQKYYSHLETLCFNMQDMSKLQENHVAQIANCVQKMTNLKDLTLMFPTRVEILSSTFISFIKSLKSLTQLSKVLLSLPLIKMEENDFNFVVREMGEKSEAILKMGNEFLLLKNQFKAIFHSELERFSIFKEEEIISQLFATPSVSLKFLPKILSEPEGVLSNVLWNLVRQPLIKDVEISFLLPQPKKVSFITFSGPKPDNEKIYQSKIEVNSSKTFKIKGVAYAFPGFFDFFFETLKIIDERKNLDLSFFDVERFDGDILLGIAKVCSAFSQTKTVSLPTLQHYTDSERKVPSALSQMIESGVKLDVRDKESDHSMFSNLLFRPQLFENAKSLKWIFHKDELLPNLALQLLVKNSLKFSQLDKLIIQTLKGQSLFFESLHRFGFADDFKNLQLLTTNCTQLSYLNLYISQWYQEESILEFLKVIGTLPVLPHLKVLKLGLSSCYELNDDGLHEIIAKISQFKELTELDLTFQNCKSISGKEFPSLGVAIESLVHLKELSLNFDENPNIQDEGFCELIKCLQSRDELQKISLCFNENPNLSSPSLITLTSSISHWKSLHKFAFHAAKCSGLSRSAISEFFETLSCLTNLTDLDLNFSWNPNIDDNTLSLFSTHLCRISSLQQLSLNFGSCSSISDHGVLHILKFLPSIRETLQSLNLTFSKCSVITDKSLENLAELLPTYSENRIKNLSLDFSECPNLSNEGAEKMSKSLSSLTRLELLNLNFSNCSKINDNILQPLASSVSSLSELANLHIILSHQKISTKTKEEVQKEIKIMIDPPKQRPGMFGGTVSRPGGSGLFGRR